MEPLSTYTDLFEDKRHALEGQWGTERANAIILGAAAYLRTLETKDDLESEHYTIPLSDRAWHSAALAVSKAYPRAKGADVKSERDNYVAIARRTVAVKVIEYGPKVPASWERVFEGLPVLRYQAEEWIDREAKRLRRDEFLADVITTAVESGHNGIHYWAEVTDYRLKRFEPGSLRIIDAKAKVRDREAGATEWLDLNLDTISRGIGKIGRGKVSLADSLRKSIERASRENDGGDIDSWAADVIVQAGLLGEIVYG